MIKYQGYSGLGIFGGIKKVVVYEENPGVSFHNTGYGFLEIVSVGQ